MLFTLNQEVEAIYTKLCKTSSYRGASSNQRKRLLAKIDTLEAMQWEIVERWKASNELIRQRVTNALQIVDSDTSSEFIENDWTTRPSIFFNILKANRTPANTHYRNS